MDRDEADSIVAAEEQLRGQTWRLLGRLLGTAPDPTTLRAIALAGPRAASPISRPPPRQRSIGRSPGSAAPSSTSRHKASQWRREPSIQANREDRLMARKTDTDKVAPSRRGFFRVGLLGAGAAGALVVVGRVTGGE